MSYTTFSAGIVPRSHSGKESFWRDAIAAFEASGQSVVAFCQARGLKPPTFYSWRLKLAKRDRQSIFSTPPRRQSASPAFLPVVVEPGPCQSDESFQIELRGGRVLRLPVSMPAARLAQVVHALEGQL